MFSSLSMVVPLSTAAFIPRGQAAGSDGIPNVLTSTKTTKSKHSPWSFPKLSRNNHHHLHPHFAVKTVAPPLNVVDTGNDTQQLQPQTMQEVHHESFNWFQSWYPIIPEECLDPEIPHKFTLLGMNIVLWKDASFPGAVFGSKKAKTRGAHRHPREGGQWRAFVDECPHRKVPLSEGRVEVDGSLLCSYHAFRFNGDGQLIDAPQLDQDSIALSSLKANPRMKCNSFPVQVIDGVIWVWPQSGDDARLQAALTPAPHYQLPQEDGTKQGGSSNNNNNNKRVWLGPWNFRHLPYSADFFIENVLDPAHVQVSHHNTVGSRYADQRVTIRNLTSLQQSGFAFKPKSLLGESEATTTFQAPCSVFIEAPFGDGAMQVLELYASPSNPGFCNHVGRLVIVKDKNGKMPQLLKMFTLPMPKWLNHVLAQLFLNQDMVFLHQQERLMAHRGLYTSLPSEEALTTGEAGRELQPRMDYDKAVVPIESDKGVILFRRWLAKFSGGVIPYSLSQDSLKMPPIDLNACFDQFNSHTKMCHICQTALRRLRKARFGSFFVATVLAVLRPAKTNQLVQLTAVLLSAGVGLALNKLIGLFYMYEFSHAHND
jgi:phenylpropionate dioxygenase-like ring-hydroxylating dioxygenase large terminal subunit